MCLLICLMGALSIGAYYSEVKEGMRAEASKLSLSLEDNAIIIKWDFPDWHLCDYVTVQIKDEDTIVFEKRIESTIESISYENGEHGKAYTVSASAHYRDGSSGENIEKKTLFLDYDQLPDIPLMIINTYSGDDPTYDEAEKADNRFMGATIVNNDYLPGEMVMSGGGIRNVSMRIEVRVRGNTSSFLSDKKSYKIHLDNACDLLDRNNGYFCDEWVLLNSGRDLNTYIGNYVGTLCGMEWQPQMIFVNVILNGDWKGCYCLTEAVCLESSHGLVSESGYIFENDAYWWNSGDLYFRTDKQAYELAYTFKYPEIRSKNETFVLTLKNYMQEFEDRILNGDSSYQDYIDEKSYSSWILARDILGNSDGGGSNMYFYKYDFDESDPTSSKVKMGPLWDFDGAFRMVNSWSDCRSGHVSYFPQLFSQDTFIDKYTETWEEISPYLYDNVENFLEYLEESDGEDIDESWRLDGNRWNVEIDSFYVQKEKALDWFFKRTIWMNNAMGIPSEELTTIDISEYKHVQNGITCHIDESNVDGEKAYIEGWAFITDMKEDSAYGSIGVLKDQKVYLANECGREDIQEAYSLTSDQIGFYIYAGFEGGRLCIIDEENKIIYEMG